MDTDNCNDTSDDDGLLLSMTEEEGQKSSAWIKVTKNIVVLNALKRRGGGKKTATATSLHANANQIFSSFSCPLTFFSCVS
jgi:hypothetical protein